MNKHRIVKIPNKLAKLKYLSLTISIKPKMTLKMTLLNLSLIPYLLINSLLKKQVFYLDKVLIINSLLGLFSLSNRLFFRIIKVCLVLNFPNQIKSLL